MYAAPRCELYVFAYHFVRKRGLASKEGTIGVNVLALRDHIDLTPHALRKGAQRGVGAWKPAMKPQIRLKNPLRPKGCTAVDDKA